MHSIITKELEDKNVIWFQKSNQYIVLEPMVAFILKNLSEEKDVRDIASQLKSELDIPLEKAIDFVLDVEEKILHTQKAEEKKSIQENQYTLPETFDYSISYRIHSKTFKVQFAGDAEVSLIHPKFAHLETLEVADPDFVIQIFNDGFHMFFIMNDECIGSWSRKDVHYFQGKFSMKVIESIYEKPEEK